MQQLSGMDDILLHIERSGLPMQIGILAIYGPAQPGDLEPDQARIRASIEQGVARTPLLRRLLREVPLHLDRPYWVEDFELDLDDHLQVVALPGQATWEDLCAVVARLFERPFEEARPLWEGALIENLGAVEGVPPGGFALFTKIHHALLDGVSGSEIMKAFHDAGASGEAVPDLALCVAEAPPTTADLLLRAWTNELGRAVGMAELAVKALPALLRGSTGAADSSSGGSAKQRVPSTRFNARPSPSRVFGGCRFDLASVQAIRGAVEGATLNDVVLTICAGALRRYLGEAGELPAESIVAMAPISIRSDESAELGGNRVSMMSVALGTGIEDPIARLAAVCANARGSKKSSSRGASSALLDVIDLIPSALGELAARAYRSLDLSAQHDPFMSCIVSNVPGPSEPLYLAGSPMIATYGLGPIFDGIGLIHPVLSYCGGLTIAFTSAANMMPEPEFYAACLRSAFEELETAARVARRSRPVGAGSTSPRDRPPAEIRI